MSESNQIDPVEAQKRAKAARAAAEAQEAQLRLRQRRGELVEVEAATRLVEKLAREERESLKACVSQIVSVLAEEFAIPKGLAESRANEVFNEHLAHRSGAKVSLVSL